MRIATILAVSFLLASVAESASALPRSDNEREIQNRKQSIARSHAAFCKILRESRGEERYLERHLNQVIQDLQWIRGRVSSSHADYSWVNAYLDKAQRLRDPLRSYLEFKRLEQVLLQEHQAWEKQVREREAMILKEAGALLGSLRRDARVLDKNRDQARRNQEDAKKLAREIQEFTRNNRSYARLRSLRTRVDGYSGGTRETDEIRNLLKQQTRKVDELAKKRFESSQRTLTHMLRGADHPALRETYRKYESTARLLRKNLAEIKERSRKIQEKRKRVEDEIRYRLAEHIARGQLKEAMNASVALYKDMGLFFTEMDRSAVKDALDLGWMQTHAASLKGLHAALESMSKGQAEVDELTADLKALQAAAKVRVEKARQGTTRSRLETEFRALKSWHASSDQKRRKHVELAKRWFGKAREYRDRGVFEKAVTAIARRSDEQLRGARELWIAEYRKPEVVVCTEGTSSETFKLASLLVEAGDAGSAEVQRRFQGDVQRIADSVLRNGFFAERELEKPRLILTNASQAAKAAGTRVPDWVSRALSELERLKGLPRDLEELERLNQTLEKELKAFHQTCDSQMQGLLHKLNCAKTAKELIAAKAEVDRIERLAEQKLEVLGRGLEAVQKRHDGLGRYPTSGREFGTLFRAVQKRRQSIGRSLAEARASLQRDEDVQAIVEGYDGK